MTRKDEMDATPGERRVASYPHNAPGRNHQPYCSAVHPAATRVAQRCRAVRTGVPVASRVRVIAVGADGRRSVQRPSTRSFTEACGGAVCAGGQSVNHTAIAGERFLQPCSQRHFLFADSGHKLDGLFAEFL